MNEDLIIKLIKKLSISIEHYGKKNMSDLDINTSQGFILYYLLSEKNRTFYARDIHREFGLSKATVSAILKSLKAKGYIVFSGDFNDERRKKIILTDKALTNENNIKEIFNLRKSLLCRGISEYDLNVTLKTLDRMFRCV